MSIKFQNQTIAGKYKEQIIPFANTIDAGIAKIATQEEINEGTNNTSIITPLYLSAKQDKLTAGKGISIDATNTISSDISIDNITIVQNDDKSLSTVARKTKNDKIIIDWEGTEAEYHQALLNNEINPDWYCYITDDEQAVSYVDVLHRNLDNLSPEGQAKFDEKSNIDLDNLSEVGEKHFLNKTQITNCLLELPQRIKFDLADGVLTLKAGSIVTIPNGLEEDGTTPKFDYLALTEDIVYTLTVVNYDTTFCISPNNKAIFGRRSNYCFSGSTEPAKNNGNIWYDTATNTVKRYLDSSGQYEAHNYSLPFMITNNGNIKQIFNGIGYIGSTVWVDKGVKFLIPNGRNEDGSLKNIEQTLTNLVCSSSVHAWIGQHKLNLLLSRSTLGGQDKVRFSINKIVPDGQTTVYSYSEQDNYWYYTTDAGANWSIYYVTLIGSIFSNSNDLSINEFQIKKAFRALDYNDKPEIISWGMPSAKSVALTVGASGSHYIMPANGYLNVGGRLTTSTTAGSFQITGNGLNLLQYVVPSTGSSGTFRNFCPVKKGDSMYFSYTNLTIDVFNFVYAQGET